MKKCCHFESAVITEKSSQAPKPPVDETQLCPGGVNCSRVAEKRQAPGRPLRMCHEKTPAFRDLISGKLRVFDILETWEESPFQKARWHFESLMQDFQQMPAAILIWSDIVSGPFLDLTHNCPSNR